VNSLAIAFEVGAISVIEESAHHVVAAKIVNEIGAGVEPQYDGRFNL
jgi:hypothetical protein